MYNNIAKHLQTPPLYKQTEGKFWDDEHISKQMLKAHLAPHKEGASRTHQFMDESVQWIAEQVPSAQYRNLLDVGCGPGLYAQRFCGMGYRVTGIDYSKRSIEYARDFAQKQGLRIEYFYKDYLQMDFENRFDFAAFIYCDYGALPPQNRKRILQNIYSGLKPGGRLLLDVFSAAAYRQFAEGKTWNHCPGGGFWSAESYLALEERRKYPNRVTLEQTVLLTAGGSKPYYLWNTYFTPKTLLQETSAAGFINARVFANVAGAAYTKSSPTLAVILQK